jgi:hypothetical protein
MIVRQVLYHLSHIPSPFFFSSVFSYFSGKVLHFCLGLASDLDLPSYSSHIIGMTGLYCHTHLTD